MSFFEITALTSFRFEYVPLLRQFTVLRASGFVRGFVTAYSADNTCAHVYHVSLHNELTTLFVGMDLPMQITIGSQHVCLGACAIVKLADDKFRTACCGDAGRGFHGNQRVEGQRDVHQVQSAFVFVSVMFVFVPYCFSLM